MNEKDFVKLCKKVVADYANRHLDKTDGKQIAEGTPTEIQDNPKVIDAYLGVADNE